MLESLERDISDYVDGINAPKSSSRGESSSQSSDEGDCDDVKVLRTKLK